MRCKFRCVNIFARYKYDRPVLPANGDADQIRSANYGKVLNSQIFFLFGPHLFLRSKHSCLFRIAFCQTNRLFILLERAEKEICFSMANGMFKTKKWTSIATVPDLCPTTVKIWTHHISRYQLPLKKFFNWLSHFLRICILLFPKILIYVLWHQHFFYLFFNIWV